MAGSVKTEHTSELQETREIIPPIRVRGEMPQSPLIVVEVIPWLGGEGFILVGQAESDQRLRPRAGFSMPSLRMRERSVLAWRFRIVAAPPAPSMTPSVLSSTETM